jgi:hypothetical protein
MDLPLIGVADLRERRSLRGCAEPRELELIEVFPIEVVNSIAVGLTRVEDEEVVAAHAPYLVHAAAAVYPICIIRTDHRVITRPANRVLDADKGIFANGRTGRLMMYQIDCNGGRFSRIVDRILPLPTVHNIITGASDHEKARTKVFLLRTCVQQDSDARHNLIFAADKIPHPKG